MPTAAVSTGAAATEVVVVAARDGERLAAAVTMAAMAAGKLFIVED